MVSILKTRYRIRLKLGRYVTTDGQFTWMLVLMTSFSFREHNCRMNLAIVRKHMDDSISKTMNHIRLKLSRYIIRRKYLTSVIIRSFLERHFRSEEINDFLYSQSVIRITSKVRSFSLLQSAQAPYKCLPIMSSSWYAYLNESTGR